jgi:hypothetical protein
MRPDVDGQVRYRLGRHGGAHPLARLPAVSEIVRLPTQRGGVEAKFGLDLKGQFAKIAGADQPGTYLVGLRPTTAGSGAGSASRSPISC